MGMCEGRDAGEEQDQEDTRPGRGPGAAAAGTRTVATHTRALRLSSVRTLLLVLKASIMNSCRPPAPPSGGARPGSQATAREA